MSTPAANGLTMPSVTIRTLLDSARSLLLDPAQTPVVPTAHSPYATLQDVRVRGRGVDANGLNTGTLNWTPGSGGWPWAILTATGKKVSIKESGRQWEDWRVWLHIGLLRSTDGQDPADWAMDWDTAITQFIAYHRGIGLLTVALGDTTWTLEATEMRPMTEIGVSFYGLLVQTTMHNVIPVTYGR